MSIDATDIYVARDNVLRIPRDGSAPVALAANPAGAGYVATDATSVYWTSVYFPLGQARGTIAKVAKNGVEPPVTLATAPSYAVNVVVRDGDVYWLDGEGAINRVGVNGGPTSVVANTAFRPFTSSIYNFVVDDVAIYFSQFGAIQSIPRAGGPAHVLAQVPQGSLPARRRRHSCLLHDWVCGRTRDEGREVVAARRRVVDVALSGQHGPA